MNINIEHLNIYNYLSGRKKIKYNEISKYDGATYDLESDITWTNYKKDYYLNIRNVNIISLYIPYEKLLLLYDNKFKNIKILEEIIIKLNDICDSKIIFTFNIGFWKSIIEKRIIKDIILKLTQKNKNINKLDLLKYIEIAKDFKDIFKEESICLEINESLFIV